MNLLHRSTLSSYYFLLLLIALYTNRSVDAIFFGIVDTIRNSLPEVLTAITLCYDFYSSYGSSSRPLIFIFWDKFQSSRFYDFITGNYDEVDELRLRSVCSPSTGYVAMGSTRYEVTRGSASIVTLQVVRTNGFDGIATIDYHTIPDTAQPGKDYVSITTGTVTFAAGESGSKSFNIQLNPIDLTQPTVQFKVTIDNPSGMALLAPRTATVTIFADKSVLPNYIYFNSIQYLQLNGNTQQVKINDKPWWDIFNISTNGKPWWDILGLFTEPIYGLRITNTGTGSVFYERTVSMESDASFRAYFNVKLLNENSNPGPGFAFLVQNDPSNGANAFGGDYGFSSMQNYIAVVFDIDNSIAVTVNGIEITRATSPFNLLNEDGFYVWVDYNGESNSLAVYISNDENKPRFVLLQATVDFVSEVGPLAYFGFTGDTDVLLLQYRLDQLVPPKKPPLAPDGKIKAVDIANMFRPTAIDWLPNGLMLVSEKSGIVYVFDGTERLETPFYNIEEVTNSASDRGLLSLRVYPKFSEDQPYVFLAYTYEGRTESENPNEPGTLGGYGGKGNRVGRLVRVTADKNTSYTTVVPGSEYILVGKNSTLQYFNPDVDSSVDLDEPPAGELPDGSYVKDIIVQDSQTHGVCGIAFSPDGNALYFGVGDGGAYNTIDPRNQRSIDIDSLSGKVLRIDPITGDGLTDNPFYSITNEPGANSAKVYQLGLRHPYTLSVDKTDGALYIGEVGLDTYEEINTGGPGTNFGWPYYEGGDGGNILVPGYAELEKGRAFLATNPDITPPLFALNHYTFDIGAVIVGPVVSTDYYGAIYQGNLLFNNFDGGVLYNAVFDDNKQIIDIGIFYDGLQYVADIIEGPDGLLYYAVARGGNWRIGRWELV